MRRFCTFIVAAAAGLFMMSCIDNEEERNGIKPIYRVSIAVVTADVTFSAANFEIISTDDYSLRPNLINGLHTDITGIRAFGGDIYILESFGKDNIIKYNSKRMAIAYQQSLGVGLNIQDITVISQTKAYISSLNNSNLIVFNPSTQRPKRTAGRETGTIDLSRFNTYAETDSAVAHPFVKSLAYHNGYLYAACQRLNAFFGLGDTSLIAIIDTRNDEIVGEIKLNKKNPAAMSIFEDRMLVVSQGSWMDVGGNDAGVEMIDLTSRTNSGVVAEGSALGGNPDNVIFISADKAYISVMFDDWSTGIIPFDLVTGAGEKIDGIGDGAGGLAYDGFKVYVGDRGFGTAGVAVIDPTTNTIDQRITTGMPPSALAVIIAD